MPRTPLFVFGMILGMCVPGLVLAQSSSTNYILWDTSINAGGGRTTSTNYINFSTVTDIGSDRLNSTNYRAYQGFEAITEDPRITFSITPMSVTLSPNPLTTVSVSSGSTTATVSTNADFGYVLSATEASPLQNQYAQAIADVSDGAVTAGSEEFGVAVSGSDAAFGTDQPLTGSPLTIASKPTWGADRATTVTFKAAIAPATDSGEYSGAVTLIATGRY